MDKMLISKELRAFIHKSIHTFIRVPLSCTVYKDTSMYVLFKKLPKSLLINSMVN